jgi:serine/threonine-protein kinase RsbW
VPFVMSVMPEEIFDLSRYSPGAFPSRLQFEVPASVDAIDPAVDKAMHFAASQGCIRESDFDVRLALQEALANAVLHGCHQDRGKTVQCLIACERSRALLIVVRDPGAGFDPSAVPCPTAEHRLFEDHGRGIELMRNLVDEVHFERNGTEIHLLKHWPAHP